MNSENINSSSTNSDQVSLKELILSVKEWWKYLTSKWLIILGFCIMGGLFGFTYAYLKKTIYIATTTFVLEESEKGNGGLGQYSGLASIVGLDLGGGGGIFQGDNILELYKSRTMIEKALLTEITYNGKKQLLIDRYIEFNNLKKKWAEQPYLKNIQFKQRSKKTQELQSDRLQDSILGSIVIDINKYYLNVAKPDKKLNLIRAEVRSSDEYFAKNFNNQIVKNVNDFYLQTKTKKSLENLAILQHQTDSVKNVLRGAIYSSASVIDATPNLNPTRQILRAPAQGAQFNAESNKAILTQLVQNLELSKVTLRKETPLIQVIDEPIYPLIKDSYSLKKWTTLGAVVFGLLAIVIIISKKVFYLILN